MVEFFFAEEFFTDIIHKRVMPDGVYKLRASFLSVDVTVALSWGTCRQLAQDAG